jgi:PKD repeat protein
MKCRREGLIVLAVAALVAAPSAGAARAAHAATCSGPIVKLLDSTNVYGVLNGAKPPSFSTKGKAYCVVQITTYHWNNGLGKTPGKLGLTSSSGSVGPFQAKGSAGQGGAPNVNWQVNLPTAKPVVVNGIYSCSDSDPTTWSQNPQSHGTGFCTVYGIAAYGVVTKPTPAPATKATYTCSGAQLKLFDSSNVFGVENGAKPPAFTTKGKAYCLASITTYHWNNGQGKKPGTIGLAGTTKVGPLPAKGSSGQGGAPNVNWTVTFSTAKPVVIDGSYTCTDSDPASWSQNPQSAGKGFCIVYVVAAVKKGGASTKATTTKKKTPKPPAKKKPAPKKPAAKAKGGKGKLSIKATPDNGNPPLTVTFALSSPKVVQWRIDYGDGQSKVAIGSPPASITHAYSRAGDYRPRLTVLASPTATSASSVTTSVTVGTSLMSFAASPTSGSPPLHVTFTLGTSVQNITTWSVDFGDGQHTGGAGKPPGTVSHTYAKAGTYAANFAVKPGQYAVVAAFAQVTVGGGIPPTLSLTAAPTSGTHPLTVGFTLGTNIPGQVVSWVLQFGDGFRAQGSGRPPGSVTHTYSKAGVYLAYLVVAQQQQYGGVQYIVPRNGLPISVG